MGVVKVTVWVDFAEDAQAQPTEVLFTRGAGHLITAVNFLRRNKNKEMRNTDDQVLKRQRKNESLLNWILKYPLQ